MKTRAEHYEECDIQADDEPCICDDIDEKREQEYIESLIDEN